MVICNYPGGPHITAAIWPCTYLFSVHVYFTFLIISLFICCRGEDYINEL